LPIVKIGSRQLEIGNYLFISVSDAPAGQVVRRHLNTHAITDQNPDAVLSHLPGYSCQYHMFAVIKTDFEKGVGLFIDNDALRRD
jgi:hypothetical protein